MNRFSAASQGNSRPAPARAAVLLAGTGLIRAAVSRGWMWLALVLLVTGGCGDDSSSPPPRRNVGSPAGVNLPHTMDAGRGTPSEDGGRGMATSRGAGDQNATAAGKTASGEGEEAGDEPKRPKEVAQWKPDDYLSAKKDGDPQLIVAVTLMGKKYPENAKAATLLVKLLAVEKKETPEDEENSLGGRRGEEGPARGRGRPQTDDGYGRGGYGEGYDRGAPRGGPRGGPGGARGATQPGQLDTDRLAKTVIAALCNNTTPPARKAIQKLLTGKLESVLERREAVTDVVTALASFRKKENEQILYALITQPQKFSSAQPASGSSDGYDEEGGVSRRGGRGYASRSLGGTGPITPDWLQGVALQTAEPRASADFRTRLGTFLNDPNAPVEIAEPLEQFLATEDPRNFGAQVVLYKNQKTTPDIRLDIEDRLTTGSIAALAYLLDVPAGASVGGASRGNRGRMG